LARAPKNSIHKSIKVRLGYSPDQKDAEVLRDWKQRVSRVCKPCWELKYCPYGPLVEQAPTLPTTLSETAEHVNYLKSCLETGMLGKREPLSDERRSFYQKCLQDDDVLIRQALFQLQDELRVNEAMKSDNPIKAWLSNDLPPIHIYRVPYNYEVKSIRIDEIDASIKEKVLTRVADIKRKKLRALESGFDYYDRTLDPIRRAWFQDEVENFKPGDYPEEIPQIFEDGVCNIFGHICPVFFSAESITETESERRRGRYIPFATKMRIVRRDNHTCQICGVHLRDDEVEFDHIIPISRGGSSEEHNVRLTCYDCNRDKKDKIYI